MIIVAITDFRDKTSAKQFDKMVQIKKGTLIECDTKLALERIQNNLAIEVLNPEILKVEVIKETTGEVKEPTTEETKESNVEGTEETKAEKSDKK